MTRIAIVGPDDGEVALAGPTRMRILEDGTTTGHRLGLGEITIAPHTDGPQQHRHAQHDEGFYVVSGTATFTVGETAHEAPAGSLVMVPPGAPHTFANHTDQPAVLLNTFTPDLYVQYFRDLHQMIESGQPMTDDAVRGVMAKYATEPATTYPDDDEHGAGPTTPLTRTVLVHLPGTDVPVTLTDRGAGPAVLLLHGGGGPATVSGLAEQLAGAGFRVIAPIHPGFESTPRPELLDSVPDLAKVYAVLLEQLGLADVTVIGNSVGGWITAELGVAGSGRIGRLILVDAVGLEVPGHLPVDFFSLAPQEIADYSFHDSDRFRIDPSTMSPQQLAVMAGNGAVLGIYAGTGMTDRSLEGRLSAVTVPTLVLWGDSDRIVDPEVGRAFAVAITGATFRLLPDTGHLPQLETPKALLAAITGWMPPAPPA